MKFIRYTTLRRKAFGAIVLLLIVGGWGIFAGCNDQQNEAGGRKFTDVSVLENAFQHHQSNLQVTQQGHIVKVLPDDTRGTRHQRFLVKLSSGQTLLVAHNIDLAPRVPGLQTGETIIFHGEYEWNDKGGVIHWTHHDPDREHENGYLEYHGKKYQ